MKRKKTFWRLIGLVLIILVSLLSFVGYKTMRKSQGVDIKITSMTSTESSIMANMISELINHELGYQTTLITNLGSANVQHQALLRGDADIASIRYTGTDLTGTLSLPAEKDPQKASRTVKKEFQKRFDQTWFPTYGFSDTYAFMVTSDYAKKYNLQTVSDLKKVQSSAKVGVDSTWMNREGDGYRDFAKAYGFNFKSIYPMQIGLVYDAVESDKMQTVLGYSTDGRISSYDLTILEDDKRFFPPYEASMVVNNNLLRKYPKLKKVLHRLDGKINLKMMQQLNYQVDDKLLEPSVVAHNFLREHNYFREAGD